MKKIYYLLAFVAAGFTACQKQPIVGAGGSGSSEVKTLNLTLGASDYSSLGSSVYASKTKSFNSDADAKQYIPTILNNEYPQLSNGSVANIVFSEQPVFADSLYKDQQYTLVTTPTNDYKLLPGNNFSDFSVAQTLAWLPYKFPTPTDPQQEILTFIWYNGQTTVPGTTFGFLYSNGSWKQEYLLTPAQYASVGRPAYSQFPASDDANIPSFLNAILKADPSVMATAKAGISVQYVSFNYYLSSTKVTSQRVFAMGYNGTDWVKASTTTLAFLKSGNTWIPDPTVYYTLNTADTKLIAASTFGTAAQRTNLGQYGDFSGWAKSDVQSGIILVLTTDFPNPKPNINYKVTYLNYTGGADVPTVLVFQYNGTAWVAM